MYALNNKVTSFDSFGVEKIPKETIKLIDNKNIKGSRITTNIFRIQAYDSVMCGYLCIGFINFILKGKSLTDYTNPFLPDVFNKNHDIILNFFENHCIQFHWSI